MVEVSELVVPAPSWAVFTSAYWQVSAWRDVPIVLTSITAPYAISTAAASVMTINTTARGIFSQSTSG